MIINWLRKYLKRLGGILVIISIVSFGTFRQALEIYPFDPDNLIALSLAVRSNPLPLIYSKVTSYMPAYRPVAYLSLWMDYEIFGLNPKLFFLMNQIIWIACGILIFILTYYATSKSKFISALSASLFLFDIRATTLIIWLGERQTSLAVFFGLLGMVSAIIPLPEHRDRYRGWGIFACLLFSALAKEYGLAFVGAVLILVWQEQPQNKVKLSVQTLLAPIVYFLMRFVLAKGAVMGFCEDMGYFYTTRAVCYGQMLLLDQLKQQIFNCAVTLTGTLFPSVLSDRGQINGFYTHEIWWESLIAIPAIVAWIKNFPKTLPFLSLVLFNSLLSFMLYRTRNHQVGLTGLYISFGIGVNLIYQSILHNKKYSGLIASISRTILIACFTLLLAMRIANLNYQLALYQQKSAEMSAKVDPCSSYKQFPRDIREGIVNRVKQLYNLSDPYCKDSYYYFQNQFINESQPQ